VSPQNVEYNAPSVAPVAVTPVVIKQELPPVVVSHQTEINVAETKIPEAKIPEAKINFSEIEKEIAPTTYQPVRQPTVIITEGPHVPKTPQEIESQFETEVSTVAQTETAGHEPSATGESQEKRRFRHHRNRYRQRSGQRRRQNNPSQQNGGGDNTSGGNGAEGQ
jgi:hypothetical protein